MMFSARLGFPVLCHKVLVRENKALKDVPFSSGKLSISRPIIINYYRIICKSHEPITIHNSAEKTYQMFKLG